MNTNNDVTSQSIEDVREFWSGHPCGSDTSESEERLKYFQEIESYRYTKIRSIKGIAEFDKFKNKSVLEVGCGVGTDGRQFGRNGAIYTGINLDEGSTKLAREGFEVMNVPGKVIQMNAEQMEFHDQSFDHIYSHGVIHHSPNTEKIVSEMYRVLKPGGTVNVMIYNKSSINYHLGIMFLRKIFRLLLYPKGAPKFFARLFGQKLDVLEGHRRILINEKMTKERWISINTDGPDCPLAKVYDEKQATRIFESAGFINIQNHIRYFNKSHFSVFGRLIPDTLADRIGNMAGWHRWVKATKPIDR